jgi:EAL domain-containing protein (putative c-di-GMP-specific phosphodiesterase class I)
LRSQLVLEVTESMMVDPGTGALDLLAELRDLGTRVAVDDFGTGYSSLAALRTLPADELKIDRAFIHGLADDEKNQEMVRVVVAMANILGMEVTAEGAETAADVELVRTLGCDLIQGFGVGRPQKPAEIEAWLDDPSHPAGTTADLPA